MFYRGIGGHFSPHCPELDVLLSDALAKAGYRGRRCGETSIMAATERDHALEYARSQQEDHLLLVEPHRNSVISWVNGSRDLLLDFGIFLREAIWHHREGALLSLLKDVSGDVNILNTYVARGLKVRHTTLITELFVRQLEVHEVAFDGATPEALKSHSGEVWITGGFEISPCPVAPSPAA